MIKEFDTVSSVYLDLVSLLNACNDIHDFLVVEGVCSFCNQNGHHLPECKVKALEDAFTEIT